MEAFDSTDHTEEAGKPAFKQVIKSLGPGLITGASDDDPSGIATYSMAGATYGYSMLWTAPLFFPLIACVEYICAKIAMVSGTGLAGVMRQHYSKRSLYACVTLLLIANTINVGTDIGAISAAGNLIIPQIAPVWFVPIVVVIVLIIDFVGSYRAVSMIFKILTLSLLSYFLCAFFVKIDLAQVISQTLIPQMKFDTAGLMMFVALLGTTISPYCLFWQASQEVEEEVRMGRIDIQKRLGATTEELRSASVDVDLGMFLSVLVMYFIMLTTGATLHLAGKFRIDSASDAALALCPLAGETAGVIFALGIIGTGFLAIPVLTDSAAFAVGEALGYEPSLNETPMQDKLFYSVITLSTIIGMTINFVGINPIQALFATAVINGILTPPLLIMVMRISNNKDIMGERTNSTLTNIVGWLATGLSVLSSLLLFFFFIDEHVLS